MLRLSFSLRMAGTAAFMDIVLESSQTRIIVGRELPLLLPTLSLPWVTPPMLRRHETFPLQYFEASNFLEPLAQIVLIDACQRLIEATVFAVDVIIYERRRKTTDENTLIEHVRECLAKIYTYDEIRGEFVEQMESN